MVTPLVSVVMPAFNAGKTIRRAIDSVLCQTYSNFELIIVNDGSKDNTLSVCNTYSDKRMIVVSHSNKGLAKTRNVGIEKAKGDYIVFIDSDDWYENTYIENLYRTISENDSQLAVCGMSFYKSNGVSESLTYDGTDENLWNNDAFLSKFESGIMNSACNKIYDLQLIKRERLSFESLAMMEDIKFNICYLKYVKRVSFVPACLYNYDNTTSVLTSRVSPDMFENYIRLHAFLFSLVSLNSYQTISRFIYHQYLALCLKYLNNVLLKNISFSKAQKIIGAYTDNPMVRYSFCSYRPNAVGETVIYILLKKRLYRLLLCVLYVLFRKLKRR